MKLKKLLLIAIIPMMLSGCVGTYDLGVVDLPYYDQSDETVGFNRNLFYDNNLDTVAADPTVIYVSKEENLEYGGYFYLYGTTGNTTTIGCWRSADLANWSPFSTAFIPSENSWSKRSLWAPDISYDAEIGKYILAYSGTNLNPNLNPEKKSISFAISDNPGGPFKEITGYDAHGNYIDENTPVINVLGIKDIHPDYNFEKNGYIDIHIFNDPVSQDRYAYMVRGTGRNNQIVGMKMIDWLTPDYSTYTILTEVNKTTVGGDEVTEFFEDWLNEGPDVIYHNGKYYLLCSVNETTDKMYTVIQAVGDTPLGPFTKIQQSEGGLVLSPENEWDHVNCSGHNSHIKVGDELFIVYHQFIDRQYASSTIRGIAIDRLVWYTRDDGLELLKAVGPTYSPQPLPAEISGYKNIAPLATVSATGVFEGQDLSTINDGAVRLHDIDVIDELLGDGVVSITLDFDHYVKAKALLLYNTYDFDSAFYHVARIDFSFKTQVEGKNATGTARIENLYYDFDKWSDADAEMIRPGAPLIVEFDELDINSVTVTFVCPRGQEYISISEIMLLGRDI